MMDKENVHTLKRTFQIWEDAFSSTRLKPYFSDARVVKSDTRDITVGDFVHADRAKDTASTKSNYPNADVQEISKT